MTAATWTVGQCVSWDIPHDGTATVLITYISGHQASYVSRDGTRETADATAYRTLAQATAGWRPATPAETAAFHAGRKPQPENWH